MTPILVGYGVPLKYAIAASMVTIIATSSGSAASYVRQNIANMKAAFYLEVFTVIGAIVGSSVTALIAPRFLYFFFAAFLILSLLGLSGRLGEEFPKNVKPGKVARYLELKGSYFDQAASRTIDYEVEKARYAGPGMLVAGLAAGMLGIGAGAFKVSVQEVIMKMPSKVSSATSNFIIGVTALAGASVYFTSHLLFVSLAAPMAIGTTIGALIGGRVLNRIPNRIIRYLFLVVVVLLIIQMIYKGVTVQ